MTRAGTAGSIYRWGKVKTNENIKLEVTISREFYEKLEEKRNKGEEEGYYPQIIRTLLSEWVKK